MQKSNVTDSSPEDISWIRDRDEEVEQRFYTKIYTGI